MTSIPPSPRCRYARSPTRPCPAPGSWAPSTPTSGWSASAARPSACTTPRWRPPWTPTTSACRSGSSRTAPGASPPGIDLTPDGAARVAAQAVEVAGVARAVNREPIELAPEPVHGERTWISAYDIDPFDVPTADKIALLAGWSRRLLGDDRVDHVDATLLQVKENKFFADLAGTVTTQQRVRLHPVVNAVGIAGGLFDTMRTLAPPAGYGWEWLSGEHWDWDGELARVPELLAEKLAAPSVDPGVYDVVVDPSNLWLTIHESIGHATELTGRSATRPPTRAPRSPRPTSSGRCSTGRRP